MKILFILLMATSALAQTPPPSKKDYAPKEKAPLSEKPFVEKEVKGPKPREKEPGLRSGGTGTHGGNHLKDRFLLAAEFSEKFLRTEQCRKAFTAVDCKKMAYKLAKSQLVWLEDSSRCLQAMVKGQLRCVTAKTTPEYSSPIIVDLHAAEKTKISFAEAVVLMVHEAGHAVGLSENLITDQRIIKLIPSELLSQAGVSAPKVEADLNWAKDSALNVEECRDLKERLEKVYETEYNGPTGVASEGWNFTHTVRQDHEQFMNDIWQSMGEKGHQEVNDFLMTLPDGGEARSKAVYEFTRHKAPAYTAHLKKKLGENGMLIAAHVLPDEKVDAHLHSVEVLFETTDVMYEKNRLIFRVCTLHYEDAQFVNATRFHECSDLYFEAFGTGAERHVQAGRYGFGDGGQYNDYDLRGHDYSLWHLPSAQSYALKAVGQHCERKLRDAGLVKEGKIK